MQKRKLKVEISREESLKLDFNFQKLFSLHNKFKTCIK